MQCFRILEPNFEFGYPRNCRVPDYPRYPTQPNLLYGTKLIFDCILSKVEEATSSWGSINNTHAHNGRPLPFLSTRVSGLVPEKTSLSSCMRSLPSFLFSSHLFLFSSNIFLNIYKEWRFVHKVPRYIAIWAIFVVNKNILLSLQRSKLVWSFLQKR